MKRYIFILFTALALCLSLAGCTGKQKRSVKSFKSNMTGGLNRTVTLYDYNGKEIQKWSGKIDLSESERETDFLLTAKGPEGFETKRIIVHGGITVIEEQ